jgi:hypothetical protein
MAEGLLRADYGDGFDVLRPEATVVMKEFEKTSAAIGCTVASGAFSRVYDAASDRHPHCVHSFPHAQLLIDARDVCFCGTFRYAESNAYLLCC